MCASSAYTKLIAENSWVSSFIHAPPCWLENDTSHVCHYAENLGMEVRALLSLNRRT